MQNGISKDSTALEQDLIDVRNQAAGVAQLVALVFKFLDEASVVG